MYAIVDYLKYSWLARVAIMILIVTHWLPTYTLPYAFIGMIVLCYWMIDDYSSQPAMPPALYSLLDRINKDRGSSLTISLRLSPKPTFSFSAKNYIFSDDEWDIHYYGHNQYRYLELGPKALSQRPINIHIFHYLTRLIPSSRLQRVLVSLSTDILQPKTSVHYLDPYFKALSKRFIQVPYDLLVNHFWEMPISRKFYAFDFHSHIDTSQYCQLLKQHVEESITHTVQQPTQRLANYIVALDSLIQPLQGIILAIQNHPRFRLQCALIYNAPIEWHKHLPKEKPSPHFTAMWIYAGIASLIALSVWQAKDSISKNLTLKQELHQQTTLAQIEPVKKASPVPHLNLLMQTISYARSHNLLQNIKLVHFPDEQVWDPSIDLSPPDLVSQLQQMSDQELSSTIDQLITLPTVDQLKESSSGVNTTEDLFIQRSVLYCIKDSWQETPQTILSDCVQAQQQQQELAWTQQILNDIHKKLTVGIDQSTMEHENSPKQIDAEFKSKIPVLIHFAAKYNDENTLHKLSQLSQFMSHYENSRTWHILKRFSELQTGKASNISQKAINELDAQHSSRLESQLSYANEQREWQAINQSWQHQVLPAYGQLKSCFPFKIDAQNDCSQTLITQFFQPDGILDQFIKKNLKDHIKADESGIHWTNAPKNTAEHFLEQLMLAQIIQHTLFNNRGIIELPLTLKASYIPPNAHIRFQLGHKVYDITENKKPEIKLRWQPYSQNTLSITHGNDTPEVYRTPWGLYRWIIAHMHDEQPDTYTLSMLSSDQQVMLKLFKQPGIDPWDPRLMSSFALPSEITKIERM